ncbi:DNA gyrase inhibitor YacG [Paludibacterium sp. dN 18-1]|uniref:DNA gyrase inhibitor YacG n=1 Tax=Paludibacterium denitrificans TaxID=2675226 RepID=A0A844GER6_9NEIS|nr:DNA gyrase inhibitor YacG [Paludibacterium denitrificans]
MADSPLVVHCPTCQAPVRWEVASRYRPFCSERCKLIDLGQWATESYRVLKPRRSSRTVSGNRLALS